ncbi:class III extradiol ring-cleavage dioxygenase [uncultured Desulfuromonas sp.]|uniref:DODA-type extradiol aromatic ring-opening family dioxygenase n=1 Tax=uncultured Desulfuromonas sp. TaxID=181013 RepID=UPI002AABF0CF|nr:class III extradiol ring-cleavage dioxygenase [uncultured Desulfuromonas sp.]
MTTSHLLTGQIIYFSHGGGPLPLLGGSSHQLMVEFMKKLPSRLHRPEAILVISAHWEEAQATLLGARKPALFYDYYGFSAEAYTLEYPVAGNPALAEKVTSLLDHAGISAAIDHARGFDHGVFIPLTLMYPEADIPVQQLSLLKGLDPARHLALGRALRQLKQENILVIGSGFSFHNLQAFDRPGGDAPDPHNDAFQDWLIDTCTGEYSQLEREQRMVEWQEAPGARYCHPREEHLMPLHTCLAMAEGPATKIFDDYILGKRSVAFQW